MSPTDVPLVAARAVTVRFDAVTALRDVSCEFARTGVHGLIGVNGAGKTTLVHVLTGLQPVSAGSVVLGVPLEAIGYCPDTPSFEPWLSAREVLEQSASLGRARRPTPPTSALEDALGRVGLHRHRDRRVGGFSRGMRQRLGIAAAIVRDPRLLILDEPTSALDPVGREDIIGLAGELGERMLVVFSSHILDDVEKVARDLVVLHDGELSYRGPTSGFLARYGPVDEFAVSLTGDAAGVAGRLDAIGLPWRPDGDAPNRLLVPRDALPQLLEALKPFASRLIGIERAQNSLQRAFLNAIDIEGEVTVSR